MLRSSIVLIAGLFAFAQSPAPGLPPGEFAVGFRVVPVADTTADRPGHIQVWYPARACEAPMTYAAYLRAAPSAAADPAADLRRALAGSLGAIDDAAWQRVLDTSLRGCLDAAAAGGPHPLILGIHLDGAWPITAEFLASHGYTVAFVNRRPARPTGQDLVSRIAQRFGEFVEDLGLAVDAVEASRLGDRTRVGLVGQSHALLTFAMRDRGVRAVSLQDSGFATGPEADAARRTGLWTPAALRAAVLHTLPASRVADDSLWTAFVEATPAPAVRIVVNAASNGHADVTSDGYLARRRVPFTGADHDALVRVFEGVARAHLAFFDQYVAGKPGSRPLANVLDPALFTIETESSKFEVRSAK